MAYLIYLVSFLEWFTTLSIEIIAIRNFTPIIWTNSISTSIILWVILLALSYWYYIWWKNSKDNEKIKNKIIFNLTFASIYYFFFTFVFDTYILSYLIDKSWNYFLSVLIASFLLFFVPVFLASQTIPLLSEMLKWENSWEKIWKLLFFSTIWSFAWSVLTSTVLFSLIWVEKSWVLNIFILSSLAIILWLIWFKKVTVNFALAILICSLAITFLFTRFILWENVIFQKSNSYHNIKIFDYEENKRVFSQNEWFSSWIYNDKKESFFQYIIEIKKDILEKKSENILVFWAAWFTLPQELSKEDFVKNIDVVDVDNDLKEISEKYFLEEKLSEKINFYNKWARYFLYDALKNKKKYDAVVIDVYVWKSLPAQTLTKEFFDEINAVWNNIYINLITNTDLKDDFSKNVLYTMKSSFWDLYFKDVNKYWTLSQKTNFVITNKKIDGFENYKEDKNAKIYTDDKNSIEFDLFKTN